MKGKQQAWYCVVSHFCAENTKVASAVIAKGKSASFLCM